LQRTVQMEPGSTRTLAFRVRGALPRGTHVIKAVASARGGSYESGYIPIEYSHINPQRIYRPSTISVNAVDVVLPARLNVAYVPGVGDNVAPVLQQLGVPLTIVDPDDIPQTDLSRFTTIVVGPRDLGVADWKDIPGRTVCGTVGNGSNTELVSHDARLMLFDDAVSLPDRLDDQSCTLAAQDDSFFASYFTDPRFTGRYSAKFGFAQVPWGLAVNRNGSERLGRALDLMSQIFHRDGVFLASARANRIGTAFLEQQATVWARPECNSDTGTTNPACILPALDATLKPTVFADSVTAFETWFASRTGIDVMLPMLKTAPAWSLFKDGIVNSLILVTGALVATLVFTLCFGAALGSRSRLLRWPVRGLTVTLQSSPIVLTLVIAAAIAISLTLVRRPRRG